MLQNALLGGQVSCFVNNSTINIGALRQEPPDFTSGAIIRIAA